MTAGFDDGKDESALRTIGELSEALGIKAHVLRYWEDQFPMLRPMKRSGGRRYYRAEDVALVREIHRLVNREGYTIRGARAALKDHRAAAGVGAAAPVADDETVDAPLFAATRPTVPGDNSDTLGRLRQIRQTLAAALDA